MVDITVNDNVVIIKGDITNIDDFEKIKSITESLKNKKELVIEMMDSVYITSSLIGYLYKLREKDEVDLIIKIAKNELKEVFEDLDLLEVFKVEML